MYFNLKGEAIRSICGNDFDTECIPLNTVNELNELLHHSYLQSTAELQKTEVFYVLNGAIEKLQVSHRVLL